MLTTDCIIFIYNVDLHYLEICQKILKTRKNNLSTANRALKL